MFADVLQGVFGIIEDVLCMQKFASESKKLLH
jgi:hypothetical protein